jgi:hypothetical protein
VGTASSMAEAVLEIVRNAGLDDSDLGAAYPFC